MRSFEPEIRVVGGMEAKPIRYVPTLSVDRVGRHVVSVPVYQGIRASDDRYARAQARRRHRKWMEKLQASLAESAAEKSEA